MSVKGVDRTHRMVDGRIEVLYDGQWRSYAGDFDLVDITKADGTPLTAAEFNRHVEGLMERGLIEHGGEVRVMTDVMRNSPHPPGSAEWMAQAREVWALREGLENAHVDEIVVGVHATEGLHRAPQLDELGWKGGFEAPGGGLLDSSAFAGAGDEVLGSGRSIGDVADAGPAAMRELGDE